MRKKIHPALRTRLHLIPSELVKWFIPALILTLLIALAGFRLDAIPRIAGLMTTAWLTGVFVICAAPILPTRPHSIKGALAGLALWAVLGSAQLMGPTDLIEAGWGLIFIAMLSFMALRSAKGTFKFSEKIIAIPLQTIALIGGLICIYLGEHA